MLLPDPTYLAVAELKANTLITGLSSLPDGDITKLIQRAERDIDNHVGQQTHHPEDDNTSRVFPRAEDDDCGTPVIPLKVSEACLAQVEDLFLKWWPNRTTSQPKVHRDVASEDIGGDGSYSATYADEGKTTAENALCAQARFCLTGYASRFAPLSVADPDSVA